MKPGALIAAGFIAFVWHAPAAAQASIEERMSAMERRIQYLERRVADQDKVIVEKDRQIAELAGQEDAWFKSMEIGGVVEVEAARETDYEGETSMSADVSTVELGIAAQIHDWVAAEAVLLYEGEDTDDKLEVDEAFVVVAPPEGSWSLTAGQHAVPFGVFDTNLISDPLTLEIGEATETAVTFGGESGGFHAAVFAFDGDNKRSDKDRLTGFGAALGYSMEGEESGWGVNLSYINDIGDANGLGDAIAEGNDGNVADHVAGWAASFGLGYGDVSLIGEYVAALDEFQPDEVAFGDGGAQPSAWTVEAAHEFDLAGRAAVVAASYQRSNDALALELPRTRLLAGISVEMVEGVALSFEWARDDDYETADGGTGESADVLTLKLAAEF